MIKKKAILGTLLFLCSLFSVYSCTTQENNLPRDNSSKSARVVGYLVADNFNKMNSIAFCKLTHLNLSFANPDSAGNLSIDGNIDAVIKYARSVNPKLVICISVAGGVISEQQAANWSNLIDNAKNRPIFLDKIIGYVKQHKLDGVDVDLEWDAVTTGYSSFVIELKSVLKANKKIMTAALPNLTRFENISDEALLTFDFINIMAYDMTGPWNPKLPGQHSSLKDAKDGVAFWSKINKVPKEKLTLGVPFYGYDFTTEIVTSFTFGQMIAKGEQFANIDQDNARYYNGRSTIEQKVQLASEETGGIMIWELAQDATNNFSLLDAIHQKFTFLGFGTSNLCGNLQ